MNQNFIGYFRDKFENWKYVYNKYGNLPISDFPENPQIVIIYTSTISIAEAIHKELLLDTLPFNILFLVEELINENLESAYYQPLKHQKLQRINVHLQGNY